MSWKTSPAAANARVDLRRHAEAAFPLDRSRADDVLARMGLVADPHPHCDDPDHLLDLVVGRTDPADRREERRRGDRWPTGRIL